MSLVFALVVGALFGSGVFLLLKTDLFRVVVGLVLVSNAANLTVMASGISRGQAPIQPTGDESAVADPLVQAMTLTALVLGFAITALLLAIVFRVYMAARTVDLDELARHEARDEAEAEREALET